MYSFTKNIAKIVIAIWAFMIIGCVQDDEFSVPPVVCNNNFSANLAFENVFAFNTTDEPDLIQAENDSLFEGYVVSSDEAGNFFATLVLQDQLTNPSQGLQLELDLRDSYTTFPIGSRVIVNVNNLHINNANGPLTLGSIFLNDGVEQVGRLPEVRINEHLFRTCDSIALPTPREFDGITDELFSQENLNTLIKINNIQFEFAGNGETFYDAENTIGGATNVSMIDLLNDRTLVLRNSGFADFANTELPSGKGSITGVLSAFGDATPSPSQYQLFIRDINDVDFDGMREDECDFTPAPNAEITDIVQLNISNEPDQITDSIFFDGYVISSDQEGNFFKTLSLQDSSANPSAGLQVELDQENLFTDFPVGSRVVISAQNLFVDRDRGVIKVGQTFDDGGEIRVGRVDEDLVEDIVNRTCDEVAAITPTAFDGVDPSIFTQENLNTLIRLDNVQFQSALNGETYYDANNTIGGSTNVIVEDMMGRTIVLRNSSFASFAEDALPSGSGSLTAVLSAFDSNGNLTNSDFQLFIRDLDDVQISNNPDDRFPDFCPPVNIVNQAVPFVDDFESYNEGEVQQPWTVFTEEGNREFDIREFGGNQYANMSAFNSNGVNVTWLISPRLNVDDMTDKVMSFTLQDAFQNGNPLKLMYSQDYDGSNCPTSFNWIEIGVTEIAALINNSGTFDGVFSESGDIDLSSISGEAVFAFVYSGEDTVLTTTVQIDDINFGVSQGSGGGGTPVDLLTEDFETTNDDVDINLTGWVNVDENGNLPIWQGDSFSGNRYAIANAFSDQTPATPMNIWLITPAIDLTATSNEELSFDYQQNFYNGDVLTVLYSTDYDGSSTSPQDFTWTDVTNQANAIQNNPTGFMSGFETSDPVDLSTLNGNVYIAFVYRADNAGGLTTRFHLDNIQVTGE